MLHHCCHVGGQKQYICVWEIRSIFMQNCFIVSALQHGCRENPLLSYLFYPLELSINPPGYLILHLTFEITKGGKINSLKSGVATETI